MRKLVLAMLSAARSSLKSRRELALENLALRQQLAVLRRPAQRPKLSRADRAFWVVLARVWPEWRTALAIVQPATVIRWHRKGFALYWRWTSRKRGGRPRTDAAIRILIREMARDNVGWGAPHIHGELLELGFVVSEATVSRIMPRRFQPPSQTWSTFLGNHLPRAAAIDFFVVQPRRPSARCTCSSSSATRAPRSRLGGSTTTRCGPTARSGTAPRPSTPRKQD